VSLEDAVLWTLIRGTFRSNAVSFELPAEIGIKIADADAA
jgi:hypothetical protein